MMGIVVVAWSKSAHIAIASTTGVSDESTRGVKLLVLPHLPAVVTAPRRIA